MKLCLILMVLTTNLSIAANWQKFQETDSRIALFVDRDSGQVVRIFTQAYIGRKVFTIIDKPFTSSNLSLSCETWSYNGVSNSDIVFEMMTYRKNLSKNDLLYSYASEYKDLFDKRDFKGYGERVSSGCTDFEALDRKTSIIYIPKSVSKFTSESLWNKAIHMVSTYDPDDLFLESNMKID